MTSANHDSKTSLPGDEGFAPASTGNASNPSPQHEPFSTAEGSSFLNKQAETYLREAGSIEDLPDAVDQKDDDAPESEGAKKDR